MTVPLRMTLEDLPEVAAWAVRGLRAAGYRVEELDPTQVKERAWSLVFPLETDRGKVWVKANARDFRAEAGLLTLLGRLAPNSVLPVLLADVERGWFVGPDGGRTLRDEGSATAEQWVDVLTDYAGVQRTLAAADLDGLGLPDQRPGMLPHRWDLAVQRCAQEPELSALVDAAELAELQAVRPLVQRYADELAADPLPDSVDHNDLHPGNVFVTGGALKIFDWGDATRSHPFTCLGQCLRTAAGIWDDDPTGMTLAPLREAYLRAWSDDPAAPIAPWLRRSGEVAETLSWVTHVGSWVRLHLFPEIAPWYVRFLREARTALLEQAEGDQFVR